MMPNWENPVELETQDTRRGVCHIETLGGVDVKSLKYEKAKLLANPAVRQAYDAQAPEFEPARERIGKAIQE